MNAMPCLACLYLMVCGIPMLSRSAVLGKEELPPPGVLEWIDLDETVQNLTGPIDRLAVQERHPDHQAFGSRGGASAVGSRHRQSSVIAPVPLARRAVFKENLISAIEGVIRRRGARLGEASRGDETFESTIVFTYIMKRTDQPDLVGSLVLSLCRLGEDVRVSLAGMEVETDIAANMARLEQRGEIRGSSREFWEAEPTAEDRRRGAVNEREAAQQRLSREQHAASEAAAYDRLEIDDLVGMLGIWYYKDRVLLQPGKNRLRFKIVKTGPGKVEVVEEMPFRFPPAVIDPNGIKMLLYFVDEKGSPIRGKMVSENGETKYVIRLRTEGRNAGSGPTVSGTIAWLPPGSDMARGGGSDERHPVDLRSQSEQVFLCLSRGEHTLEFRMAVDDAGESE
jgi:hypothetical protein